MNRAASLLFPSLLTAASLTGCAPLPEDDTGDKVAVVQAPLTDSFVTPEQPKINTAGGLDRYFAVWSAKSGGNDAIVGQMFSPAGVALSPSRVYDSSAHIKAQPRVSFDPVNRRFLVVWEDTFSATDDDILGVIVDESGAAVKSIQVDFSSMFEQEPSVTFVGGAVNKWLVTFSKYTNVPNAADERLRGRFVDFTGAFGLTKDITPPGNTALLNPFAQWIPSTNRVVYVIQQGGGLQALFGPAATLTFDVAASLVPAARHQHERARGAVNTSTNAFGLAFMDIDMSGNGNTRNIRLKTFAAGCEDFGCAKEQPTLLGTTPTFFGTITGVSGPQIATLGNDFILYAGQAGPGQPNGDSISFVRAQSTGGVTAASGATIPTCPTARTNSLGGNAVIAAATLRGQSNVNMVYATYCPGASKVMGQAMALNLARTDYKVSD